MKTTPPYLFISYRRDDTQWIARALHRHLSGGYGAHRVFMDRIEIRGGDDWRRRINAALDQATVVLALIGRQWLTLEDDLGRPRIGKRGDWVRAEIAAALAPNKRLIPLYVDGAEPLVDPKELPPNIRGLAGAQGIELNDHYWDAGLFELVRQLQVSGFPSHRSAIRMPERRKRVDPLSAAELDAALAKLPGWSVTTSFVSLGLGDPALPRTELYKEYLLPRFVDATAFMAHASAAIDKGQHHPRWENIWTTVRVWLTTWDIEFQPSRYDIALARLLDEQCAMFKATLKATRADP